MKKILKNAIIILVLASLNVFAEIEVFGNIQLEDNPIENVDYITYNPETIETIKAKTAPSGTLEIGMHGEVYYNTNDTETGWIQLAGDLLGSIESSAPIGSIIAWHKDYTNTPSLPAGWLECNGQLCRIAGSPIIGEILPDLNTTKGKFLRGGTLSGIVTDDHATRAPRALAGSGGAHSHTYEARSDRDTKKYGTSSARKRTNPTTASVGEHTHTLDIPWLNETRPKNMSVIWIMRVL